MSLCVCVWCFQGFIASGMSGSPGDGDTGAQDTAALLQELLLQYYGWKVTGFGFILASLHLLCRAGVVPAVVRPVNISSVNPSL